MTPLETRDLIILAAGVLLSLIFSYVPGFSDRFKALPATTKRLIMLVALLVVSAGIQGIVCTGIILVKGLTCSWASAGELARAFILAAIANQSAYQLTPQPTKTFGPRKAAKG